MQIATLCNRLTFSFVPGKSDHRFITQLLRVMRLTAILLTICCLQVAANTWSQTIRFSGEKVSLERLFQEIRKQTKYYVTYDPAMLQDASPVTVHAEDLSVTDFLNIILKDQPVTYTLKKTTIFIQGKSDTSVRVNISFLPLPITVRGRVVNENGEPVVATVQEKGDKSKAATTDEKGYFELYGVDENAVLIISGVNIETREVKISGRKDLGNLVTKIKITEAEAVTVTTAYGIEKRTKELGYSVAKITGEELMRTSPSNIFTGLTGKVSGLVISNQGVGMNPENNIMLRGIRSINGSANNQPLIILNGSPLSFGADQNAATMAIDFINNLNPNDIEDVTVLKGANGSAIYGPEGVNGVLIINTKKGKGKGLGVNFRASTNFQRINWKQRRIQEVFGTGDLTDDNGNPIYNPHGDMLWGPAYDGKMVQLGWPDENGELQMVPYKYTSDRQKFWNTARNTQYNLSFAQSDANSDFYLGVNYTDQAGLLPKDKQHRAGILLNTGRTFNNLSIRTNIAYNYTNSDRGPDNLSTDLTPPHVPLLSYKDYINYKWADRNHYYSDQLPNPYELLDNKRNKEAENTLTGSLEFKLKPLQWLIITERPGVNFSSSYLRATTKPLDYSDYAKELGVNGRSISYQDVKANMYEKTLNMLTINNDLLLSTILQVKDFSVKATVGNTIRQSFIKDLRGSAYRLIVPVYNLQFGDVNEVYPSERSELSRFYSFFGTALIGYKDKVFVELTGRNDRDSKLAAVARNKNFYAGVNTSIVVNELIPSLHEIKWLSTLRLRASVTRTANMNIKPYQSERLLQYTGFRYEGLVGYNYMGSVPNPFLQPENVISQEYGGNISFLDSRLSIDIARYKQKNNGLILNVVNSIYSGGPTTDNAGIYNNWGWEFDLNLRQLFKTAGGFSANMRAMLAINDNKIVELPPVYDGVMTVYMNMTNYAARTGSHAFEFYGSDWKRDPQGRVIVDPGSGMPEMDYENPVYLGRTLPKYTASASLNLQWKGFSFSALGEYRGGNEQYNDQGSAGMMNGQSLLTLYNNREPFVYPNSVYDDGTGKYIENKDIKVYSVRDYYRQAAWITRNFLINAGFFTLREIALSYDFNLRKKHLQKVSAGIYGRDVLTIYARNNIYGDPQLIRGPGYDKDRGLPAYSAASQNNFGSAAADANRLPGITQYGFFITASF